VQTTAEFGIARNPAATGIELLLATMCTTLADWVRNPSTGLKIPVSGVQFSPCPPFFWSAKRRNPALGLAIRHVGSHEPRGMPCDPLGPFLIADWVPVWVPVFGAIRPIFVTVGGRAAARHRRLRARDVLLEPATSHGRPDYASTPGSRRVDWKCIAGIHSALCPSARTVRRRHGSTVF
jgi:hypothetical protein